MHRSLSVSLIAGAILLMNGLTSYCSASIMYISGPATPTGNSTFPGATYNAASGTKGYAFTAGPTGPYIINTIDFIGRNQATHTAYTETFKLDLRNTTSTIAGSALAGAVLFASDTISVAMPASTGYIPYHLTATDIPNISAYALSTGNSYSLTFYGSDHAAFGIGRTTVSNYDYTTTNGFTVLDTISNNTANPTGPVMSFSANIGYTSAVPEPSTYALLCISLGVVGFARRRMAKV